MIFIWFCFNLVQMDTLRRAPYRAIDLEGVDRKKGRVTGETGFW